MPKWHAINPTCVLNRQSLMDAIEVYQQLPHPEDQPNMPRVLIFREVDADWVLDDRVTQVAKNWKLNLLHIPDWPPGHWAVFGPSGVVYSAYD